MELEATERLPRLIVDSNGLTQSAEGQKKAEHAWTNGAQTLADTP